MNVRPQRLEEGPDGVYARLYAALRGKPLLHLYDRHVRRLLDQIEDLNLAADLDVVVMAGDYLDLSALVDGRTGAPR